MATSRPVVGHLMKSSGTRGLIFSQGSVHLQISYIQRITYPVDHTAHAMMASQGMSVVQVKHSPRGSYFYWMQHYKEETLELHHYIGLYSV